MWKLRPSRSSLRAAAPPSLPLPFQSQGISTPHSEARLRPSVPQPRQDEQEGAGPRLLKSSRQGSAAGAHPALARVSEHIPERALPGAAGTGPGSAGFGGQGRGTALPHAGDRQGHGGGSEGRCSDPRAPVPRVPPRASGPGALGPRGRAPPPAPIKAAQESGHQHVLAWG